jgi:diacylglycerol kinase (ATP)
VAKPGNTGIRRIIRATRFSAQGFASAWKHEAAFRQELILVVLMTPIAFWLGRSVVETAFLISVLLLVLIVELFNSAIEAAIDRHGDEHHELSGRAKDMGSAAVLVVLVIVGVVWGAVIWERFGQNIFQ